MYGFAIRHAQMLLSGIQFGRPAGLPPKARGNDDVVNQIGIRSSVELLRLLFSVEPGSEGCFRLVEDESDSYASFV